MNDISTKMFFFKSLHRLERLFIFEDRICLYVWVVCIWRKAAKVRVRFATKLIGLCVSKWTFTVWEGITALNDVLYCCIAIHSIGSNVDCIWENSSNTWEDRKEANQMLSDPIDSQLIHTKLYSNGFGIRSIAENWVKKKWYSFLID